MSRRPSQQVPSSSPQREPLGRSRASRTGLLHSLLLILLGAVLALAASSLRKTYLARPQRTAPAATYYCPMHPQITADHPGDCPVCNMRLVPRPTAPAAAAARPQTPAGEPSGASPLQRYQCPMHPQIVQVGPGHCPICGMALEPVLATAEQGESPELRDMTRRFWIGTALTVPVFALEMGSHLFNIHHLIAQQTSNWVQLLLGTPVVLWTGWPFFTRAVASVKNRSLNMFSLIALGTGAAWLYSIVATLVPGLFPPALRGEGGAFCSGLDVDAFAADPAPEWRAGFQRDWAAWHADLYACPAVLVGALERNAKAMERMATWLERAEDPRFASTRRLRAVEDADGNHG